jgi:hypothetical protein
VRSVETTSVSRNPNGLERRVTEADHRNRISLPEVICRRSFRQFGPCIFTLLIFCSRGVLADDGEPLHAVIPRAKAPPVIDGDLSEYGDALCTPVEYFHPDWRNRAGQFFYLWDEEAFYVGVRTLDERPFAPDELFWVGDAVEWYFDTREASAKGRLRWGPGAVHCFFTALHGEQLQPRFSLRPGYEDAIPARGIKVAGKRTAHGLEYEFKLPWSNFPDFRVHVGATLHLDAELSYSDGISRAFRTFAFGNPLSVERPANLAKVRLVETLQRGDWQACGPVMMPMRVDVPWVQKSEPRTVAQIAVPPNRRSQIGRVVVELISTTGEIVAEFNADDEDTLERQGDFVRRAASWPATIASAGSYHVQAIAYDRNGEPLTRVAPRLVSVNMEQGY